MRKKSDYAYKQNSDEENNIAKKKVLKTNILDEDQQNTLLEIVNNHIDQYNDNNFEQSTNDDGFITKVEKGKKKKNRFNEFQELKEKLQRDIEQVFKDTSNQYLKKLTPCFTMELNTYQLSLVLNFISTAINDIYPVIYDDIKPVAEQIREKTYLVYIQYFPRSSSMFSLLDSLKERDREPDNFRHSYRAKQISDGIENQKFQNLDSIEGFFEDFHIEFKNLTTLNENHDFFNSDVESNLSTADSASQENNKQDHTIIQNKHQHSYQPKVQNESKLTQKEFETKFLQTIVAMMNTQGGSIFFPIKENQNIENNKEQFQICKIKYDEQQLLERINKYFDQIIFYRLEGATIQPADKTLELRGRFIPEIKPIKDSEGVTKVYELFVYQVYPEYICNLQKSQIEEPVQKQAPLQQEEQILFPIRRSAANCTVIFSKQQMKESLEKAHQYNQVKKFLTEDQQNKLFLRKHQEQ